jgi:hypothetical protein
MRLRLFERIGTNHAHGDKSDHAWPAPHTDWWFGGRVAPQYGFREKAQVQIRILSTIARHRDDSGITPLSQQLCDPMLRRVRLTSGRLWLYGGRRITGNFIQSIAYWVSFGQWLPGTASALSGGECNVE